MLDQYLRIATVSGITYSIDLLDRPRTEVTIEREVADRFDDLESSLDLRSQKQFVASERRVVDDTGSLYRHIGDSQNVAVMRAYLSNVVGPRRSHLLGEELPSGRLVALPHQSGWACITHFSPPCGI